jgi:hypothetical protein
MSELTTASKLYDVVKPDSKVISDLKLDEKELKIVVGALNMSSNQSEYQNQYFVTASQLTPYRMLKQCMLEIEARHHSWYNVKNKLRRKQVEIKMATRDLEEFGHQDNLRAELIKIDIEDMENDCRIWERKLLQAEDEMRGFINQVKQIAGNDEELLNKAFTYDAEEERQYWITRMAKQAAMDMVSYGRIGSGNMDSIAMMPEEDQVMTLATTLQYNERLMGGLNQISNAVQQGLLENKEHLPKFDIPKVTDKLLTSELLNNVQHTAQSKVKPESI